MDSRIHVLGGVAAAAAAAFVAVAAISCSKPAAPSSRYVCPMHPQQTADKPSDCPVCGMKLIPVEAPAAPGAAPATGASAAAGSSPAGLAPIQLSGETRRQMGLTFGTVEKKPVSREIRTPARIVADQSRVARVSSPTDGWADKLWANGVGEKVKKGAPLIDVYASDWRDLAIVAREASSDFARVRLKRWGISDEQIDQMLKGGGNAKVLRIFTLVSPLDGFVSEKTVLLGQRFVAGEALFVVADLSHVWAEVDFFEADIPYVRAGMSSTVSFPYWAGKEFHGKVALLSPFLDPQTRTLKARIEIPNPAFDLRPEMYGTAHLRVDLGERLVVPEGAVMRTGERDYAFRAGQGDRIEPVLVKVGARTEGAWEILEGLAEGDRVVASANFLVDSESALKSALSAVSGK